MTTRDQMILLKKGIPVWNLWRTAHNQEKVDFSRVRFARADLAGANFVAADLSGADLGMCGLVRANLSEANLTGACLSNANAKDANLSRSHLSRSDLRGADFTGADLTETNLDGAWLSKARFDRADMRQARLGRAHLGGTSLRQADLTRANLVGADLREADLRGADLSGSDLGEADLRGARLDTAVLRGARLTAANLSGVNLTNAFLRGADLSMASLVKADLRMADLTGSRVHGLLTLDVTIDEGTNQSDLIITRPGQSAVIVDGLELAQFTSLLFDNAGIRGLIGSMATRVVLVLGRFSAERSRVRDAIKEGLHHTKFAPVFFEAKPQDAGDLSPTLELLLGMARLVILDITDPAGIPADLGAALRNAGRLPILLLRAAGSTDRPVPDEWRRLAHIIDLKEYEEGLSVSLGVTRAIEEAERTLLEMVKPQDTPQGPLTVAKRKKPPLKKSTAKKKAAEAPG